MRRFYAIGFLVLASFDSVAQLSFKLGATAAAPFMLDGAWMLRVIREPWILLALLCYLGTFFTWITLLSRAPLGPAYAISHVEVVSVLVLSHVFLGEQISVAQILGCGLIVSGIACLAVAATRAATAILPGEATDIP